MILAPVYLKHLWHGRFYICSTNDIVALNEDTFYVTNYFHYRSTVEPALLLQWGSVVYYDGQQGRVVLSNLNQPNGINKKGG